MHKLIYRTNTPNYHQLQLGVRGVISYSILGYHTIGYHTVS